MDAELDDRVPRVGGQVRPGTAIVTVRSMRVSADWIGKRTAPMARGTRCLVLSSIVCDSLGAAMMIVIPAGATAPVYLLCSPQSIEQLHVG